MTLPSESLLNEFEVTYPDTHEFWVWFDGLDKLDDALRECNE